MRLSHFDINKEISALVLKLFLDLFQASFLSSHCLSSSWQPFFNEQCFTDDMYMVQNIGNWIKELNIIMMKSYAQLSGHETSICLCM